MKIRHLGKTGIDVSLGNQTFKLYVSKYSTCDDVIQSVLSKRPNYVAQASTLAVCERSGGIERILGGSSRILKIVRSWGCEGSKFELSVKTKSTVLELQKRFQKSTRNDESFIDEVFKKHFQRRCTEMNDLDVPTYPKTGLSKLGQCNGAVNLVTKKQSCLNLNDKKMGKNALLSRYFSDVILHSQKTKYPTKRRNGDGSENPVPEISRDSMDGLSRSGLIQVCKQSWELHSDSDDETDDDSIIEEYGDFITDNDCSFDDLNVTEDKINELDIAFLKPCTHYDSDEGIDVNSVNSGDLNTAFVGDLPVAWEVDNEDSLSNASNTDFCMSVGSERRNSVAAINDFVKRMFEKKNKQSEDEAMKSFMESRLDAF